MSIDIIFKNEVITVDDTFSIDFSGGIYPQGIQGKRGPQGERGLVGPEGPRGQKGDPGHTPVKGVDYWTTSDIESMESDILQSQTITDIQSDITSLSGDLNEKADKVSNATSGNLAGLDENGNLTDSGKKPSDFPTDVQVNGTSVVSNGVANIPFAGATPGAVAVTGYGLQMQSTGSISIKPATPEQIKAGIRAWEAIVPGRQQDSVFYGLAKASGDSTQSASSNAVGTYTDSAKVAIQKMLGIYEAPWELIREDTFTNDTQTNHLITVDNNGEPFELTDIIFELVIPTQNNEVKVGGSGGVRHYFAVAQYETTYFNNLNLNANTYDYGATALITQESGIQRREFTKFNTMGNEPYIATGNQLTDNHGWFIHYTNNSNTIRLYSKIEIVSVLGTATYKLYGKRKWWT